jgi:hypothetical protein
MLSTCYSAVIFLQVSAVVEALVLKYVALTHEELEEWSSDPEGYIRCVTITHYKSCFF